MVLKKLTLLASFAFIACVGINCSSKEDKAQYDKFYGSGRADREDSAKAGSFTPSKDGDEVIGASNKVSPDSVNSLSVTENADSEQGTSTALTEGKPETAGKTTAEISEKAEVPAKKADAAPAQKPVPADIAALLNKHTCAACHNPYQRLVGPAYSEVAKKKYSPEEMVALIYTPKPEHWPGYPPMAPMSQVPKEDALKLAKWINTL